MARLTLVVLCAIACVLAPAPGALAMTPGGCPKLTPVPMDDKFFFKHQPAEGFFAPISSGTDVIPKFADKPMDKPAGEDVKVCYKAKLKVKGVNTFDSPPITCTGPSVSQIYCTAASAGAGPAAAGMGIQVPKAALNTVVDTDNKTYFAMGGCADGDMYVWSYYTIHPKNKRVHERTLEALHISFDEMKASQKKKFRGGKTQIMRGACRPGPGGSSTFTSLFG